MDLYLKTIQVLHLNEEGFNTPLFLRINTYMKDKKAAKKIIRIAKCCPEYYTEAEVSYEKIIKRRIKYLKKESKQLKK